MKALAIATLLLLPASLPVSRVLNDLLHLPRSVERWLYNPRERTGNGLKAYDRGDVTSALRDFEGARRLAPKNPSVLFNAGTAHLAAHQGRSAANLLEKAASNAPSKLLPRAEYNLGNALLASGDPAGAVSAFEKSLLNDPGQLDAKYNLELALRELNKKRQKKKLREQQQPSQEQRPNGDQEGRSTGNQRPPDHKKPAKPQKGEAGTHQGKSGEAQPRARSRSGRSVLPQFSDQPNMNAAQAAAILNAVENLERRERRKAALKKAEHRSVTEKDW